MYYFNYGADYVSAHMWFKLAAAQGNALAEMFLKDTADKMTPAQIAEAQKLAREWKPAVAFSLEACVACAGWIGKLRL